MTPCIRPVQPAILAEHGPAWCEEYRQKRAENPAYAFSWKQHDKQKVNHRILPILKEMTRDHCSYCDGYPLAPTGQETIDHFRPKSLFPERCYLWENLFLACGRCQGEKLERWDDRLLRPDEGGYLFETYFIVDYDTGRLLANPAASPDERDRAEQTIDILGLNEAGRPADRKRIFRICRNEDPQDRPYRFLFA